MKQRVISAIIALIIVIPLIMLGGYAFYIGLSIIGIIGFYEMIRCRSKYKKVPCKHKIPFPLPSKKF